MLDNCVVDAMRATLEASLPDTCIITRGSTATFNATTGLHTHTEVSLWTGACRVRSAEGNERELLTGDGEDTVARYVATVPVDAVGFTVGDTLTVTSTTNNGRLPGRPFRILQIEHGSWLLNQRLWLQDRQIENPA